MQTLSPNEPTVANGSKPALAEGLKIGGCYVLRKSLGASDENAVWLAQDEVLGKEVTLHFVPDAVAGDARAMADLRQEVKRNRQLIHPNILRVYDFVEDGSFVAISMDAFEGESLQEMLRKSGRLDPDELKPWISLLVETLADAHRIQLFHRDLSPANLRLRPNGGVLVANFGISRTILNSLERAGLAKGAAARIAYLSPQQLDGERPCASDDIYGFGVLMHELLCGAPPFSGDDIVPQIRKAVPPSLSAVRSATGSAASIPESWEKLVAGCLAKSAEGRPRNLSEVLALLAQSAAPSRTTAAASEVRSAPVVEKAAKPAEPAMDKPIGEASQKAAEEKSGTHESAAEKKPAPAAPAPPQPADQKSSPTRKPSFMDTPPASKSAAPKKGPPKGVLSANFPDLERPRSKAPIIWLLIAAGIAGAGYWIRNNDQNEKASGANSVENIGGPSATESTPKPNNTPEILSGSPDKLPDPLPVNPPDSVSGTNDPNPIIGKTNPTPAPNPAKTGGLIGSEPPIVPDSLTGASAQNSTKGTGEPGTNVKPTPPDSANNGSSEKGPGTTGDITNKQPGATAVSMPLPKLPEPPQPLAKITIPAKPTAAQLDELKMERQTAVENLQQVTVAAETAQREATQRIDAAKAQKDKRQKELDALRKTYAPVIQQSDALEAERLKFEDEAVKAQAAATEAAKQAEAARQKLADAVAKGGEKLKARQKAESELAAAASEIASLAKEVDGLGQIITKAGTIRQQSRLAQQQAEQDLQKITDAEAKVRASAMDAQRKAAQGRITEISGQLQNLKSQVTKYDSLISQLKELVSEDSSDAVKKAEQKKTALKQQIAALEAELKKLSNGAETLPIKDPTNPAGKPGADPLPVSMDAATNSLGMSFVPVGDVQFGVHLVTRKNFEAFATAAGLKSDVWRNPGFKQDDDHPVVNVTWREAEAFCKWLTEKERKAGLLKSGETYRLPTDAEWSKAVGLPPESGATPEERDMGVQDVYPWGKQWPPPPGAGNYAGNEAQTEIPIPNYNDGFPNTSPVGKFRANAAGLYDMGGNVWQWVADSWNADNRAKTLRGGSWFNGAIPLSLLSSCRISSSPDTFHDTYGFRVVKAGESARPKRR